MNTTSSQVVPGIRSAALTGSTDDRSERQAPLAISVSGVSKTYRLYERPEHRLWEFLAGHRRRFHTEFHALQDISFDVRRGETLGIIGLNGSGKSTLLQVICGTLEASRGTVATTGRVAALLELGTGFDSAFTGRENVFLNAAMLGLTRAETSERFDRIAAFADIGAFIDRPVRTYSTGMIVRLAFAVVANIDADVLIVDEALAVGDAFFVQKCMRFLREFMNRGTLLFVSHDTGAVANLCHRAIWLHQGRIIMDGRAPEVTGAYLEALAEQAWGGHGGDERAELIRQNAAARAAAPVASDQRSVEPLESSRAAQSASTSSPASSGLLDVVAADVTGRSFGQGGAQITCVELRDSQDQPVHVLRGGDIVTLCVRASASTRLDAPILGFVVKDRLGQAIFGENTFESYQSQPPTMAPGDGIEARFTFAAPILASGDYAVSVAVADGTQDDHVQHHWIHDAIVLKSATRSVATGLMGIPMRSVTMRILAPDQPLC